MVKMLRVGAIYGRGKPIPVGKKKFYQDIVLKDENDPFIPGTKIRRLRLASLGERVRVGFEHEIEAIAEALLVERDALVAEHAAETERVERGKARAKKRRSRAQAEAAA
jgi:hypothetical protein